MHDDEMTREEKLTTAEILLNELGIKTSRTYFNDGLHIKPYFGKLRAYLIVNEVEALQPEHFADCAQLNLLRGGVLIACVYPSITEVGSSKPSEVEDAAQA